MLWFGSNLDNKIRKEIATTEIKGHASYLTAGSHEMRSQCVQMQTYPGFILKDQTRFCFSPEGKRFILMKICRRRGPKAIEMALSYREYRGYII